MSHSYYIANKSQRTCFELGKSITKDFDVLCDMVNEEEMARVFGENGNPYEIRIYTEPQGNPSFHLLYNKEWEIIIQIKDFKIIEVNYGDFKKGIMLPSNIKKDIVSILKQNKKSKLTYWDFLLLTWNAINEKYPVDEEMKIPL